MNYEESISYISELSGRGISPGLENEKALLNLLGNPEEKLNIIHIAGTNGKGSVGAYIDSIIRASDMSCARFISPCVGEYANTYLINGIPAPKEDIATAASTVKRAVEQLENEGIYITSFEAETAVAFLVFLNVRTDYVLLECGMGGRLDSTNAIPSPTLAVITKISLDHTAFLGDTLEAIASEKAGIIKYGSKVISAVQDGAVYEALKDKCKAENAELFVADEPQNILFSDSITTFEVQNTLYKTQMLGAYQVQNAATAIKATQLLGINSDAIKQGIFNAHWEYRFERIGKFILDGAHNPDGAQMLAKSLCSIPNIGSTAFICACFKDKDYKKIAEYTASYAKKVYCLKAPTTRGLNPEELCSTFSSNGVNACVSQSLQDAISSCSEYDNIVVFGTLSILYEAKKIITRGDNNAKM